MAKGLIVNSLGEVFKNDECVLGSITAAEFPGAFVADETKAARASARAFRKLVDECADLTPRQKDIVKLVWRAQRLNDSQVRVQHYSGALRVSTEFIGLADDAALWKQIRAAAKTVGARIDVMSEEENREFWTVTGKGGKETKHYGAHYGKMERQIDVNIVVRELSLAAVSAARKALKKATTPLFKKAGVDVI